MLWHQKHLPFSSLCPTKHVSTLSVDTCSCYSLIKLYILFVVVYIFPLQCLYPPGKFMGRTRVGSSLSLVSVPPEPQCKPLSVISWPSSHLPQPFSGSWVWHLRYGNAARMGIFLWRTRACGWAAAWQWQLPWDSLCHNNKQLQRIRNCPTVALASCISLDDYFMAQCSSWAVLLSSVKLPEQLK